MIVAALIIAIGLGLFGLVLGALAAFTAWTAWRVEKALPPLGRFVAVDGARIHYLDAGAGPAILLVHGLGGQMRHFTYSLLDRLKGNHRVVILDRPGSGYSTRASRASAAVGAQARTIARFAATIGLERPLVVGHSLGGAVALALALNHPDAVAGLALIAPASDPQDHVPPVFQGLVVRSRLLRWLLAWTVATPWSIRNGAAMLAAAFDPAPVPRDFAIKGGGLLTLRPSSFINASRDLMAVRDELEAMSPRYENLRVPVGILFGARDRILDPVAHGRALAAKLPDAALELIDGEGHMVPMSSPDRVAGFIASMAERAAAGGKPGKIG